MLCYVRLCYVMLCYVMLGYWPTAVWEFRVWIKYVQISPHSFLNYDLRADGEEAVCM